MLDHHGKSLRASVAVTQCRQVQVQVQVQSRTLVTSWSRLPSAFESRDPQGSGSLEGGTWPPPPSPSIHTMLRSLCPHQTTTDDCPVQGTLSSRLQASSFSFSRLVLVLTFSSILGVTRLLSLYLLGLLTLLLPVALLAPFERSAQVHFVRPWLALLPAPAADQR